MVAATFWSDIFIKGQLPAFSSSFTMNKQRHEQQRHQQKSALDRLPDEILIHILSQSIIDLNSLGHILGVTQRMYQLTLHVLIHYRLPLLQIALSIDQEGKSRITSKFQFDQLDQASLSITLKCIGKTPRRYYSNRASPIIRCITMTDYYQQFHQKQQQDASMKSMTTANTCISIQDLAIATTNTDGISFQSKECDINAPNGNLLTRPGTTNKSDTKSKIINRKIQTKKEGLHILQTSYLPLLLPNNLLLQQKNIWKVQYQITRQEKHECHLLPLDITMTLDQLLLLENRLKKQQQQDKKWKLKMMGWAMNRL